MSGTLLDLRGEILASPYIQQKTIPSSRRSMASIAELGMFDLGILTQAAAKIVTHESCPSTVWNSEIQTQKLGEIVLAAARHVGNLVDVQSNNLMIDIGGPLFHECFKLLDSLTHRNSYDERYLRLATDDDVVLAQRIDRVIADHAAEFMTSDRGGYLLEPIVEEDIAIGCPLRKVRPVTSEATYFDLLAMHTVREFVDPESPFFKLGYYGIAQSIAYSLKPQEPDTFRLNHPEEYASQMEEYWPGGELNWQLPDPGLKTQIN